MGHTNRGDKSREKDHDQLANKKAESFRKIQESELKGEAFWCHTREQRIDGVVCKKIQSTSGCKAGADNCPLWDNKANLKAETKPGTPRKKASGKLSYQVIMKAHFLEVGKATLEELVDLINSHPSRNGVERLADNKNVSVGISIMKNPKRMKTPLTIDFSRKTKYYYCLDVDGMKKDLADAETKYDSDKKAKKAKKAEDPKPAGETDATTGTGTPVLHQLVESEIKSDLSKMSAKDLRAKAKAAKIKGYSAMNKTKLIKALMK